MTKSILKFRANVLKNSQRELVSVKELAEILECSRNTAITTAKALNIDNKRVIGAHGDMYEFNLKEWRKKCFTSETRKAPKAQ